MANSHNVIIRVLHYVQPDANVYYDFCAFIIIIVHARLFCLFRYIFGLILINLFKFALG